MPTFLSTLVGKALHIHLPSWDSLPPSEVGRREITPPSLNRKTGIDIERVITSHI